ncbi:hypothetical protein AB4427_14655 [Vibrio artabrorum]|uniref:hypothetical protein n=1 Tax=Vibrio artabrorum TaxID=446374 RepID=UPI00354D83C3
MNNSNEQSLSHTTGGIIQHVAEKNLFEGGNDDHKILLEDLGRALQTDADVVARSLSLTEPDTAEVRTLAPLRILSLEGVEVAHYHAPKGGWTHDSLECVDYFSVSPDGWDAYLGDQWLGSSRV